MNEQVIKIKVIDRDQVLHILEVPTDMGLNLMEALKSYELPVEGICGGMALCASCHCYVADDRLGQIANEAEQAMLDETENVKNNSRLACQIPITRALEGISIELAPELIVADDQDWL